MLNISSFFGGAGQWANCAQSSILIVLMGPYMVLRIKPPINCVDDNLSTKLSLWLLNIIYFIHKMLKLITRSKWYVWKFCVKWTVPCKSCTELLPLCMNCIVQGICPSKFSLENTDGLRGRREPCSCSVL